MIAAPLAPPVVVIPQAVDRLVAGPVVVAQEWMAARQDPAGGMETTAGAIRPGVDPAMVSFEDALRPAMVHFAAVPETHQDLLAEAIVVKGTDVLKTAVRVIAVMGTDALKTAVMESAVLMIGVSIQGALKTAAMVTAAMVNFVKVIGVSKDAALKSAGMVINALRGVVLMTGGSQTVVLELVASVMARPAAFAPAVASVEIVRLMISPVEKRLLTLRILWLMICSGAGMPLRLHWKPVVRSIASGAPVR